MKNIFVKKFKKIQHIFSKNFWARLCPAQGRPEISGPQNPCLILTHCYLMLNSDLWMLNSDPPSIAKNKNFSNFTPKLKIWINFSSIINNKNFYLCDDLEKLSNCQRQSSPHNRRHTIAGNCKDGAQSPATAAKNASPTPSSVRKLAKSLSSSGKFGILKQHQQCIASALRPDKVFFHLLVKSLSLNHRRMTRQNSS